MPWSGAKKPSLGFELGQRITKSLESNKRRQALEMASDDDSAAHEEAEKKKKRKQLLEETNYD